MSVLNRTAGAVILLCLFAFAPVFGAYQVGDTVADFTLSDAYGNPVTFSDFEGQVVLINFWTPG